LIRVKGERSARQLPTLKHWRLTLKRPKKAETTALARIGTKPVTAPRRPTWNTPTVVDVQERTGQAWIYHTCDFVTGSWSRLQDDLNERQRDLEALYGPWVELVNVYRKNTTQNGGQCVVVIFKIFLGAR
jgi:hypothetical protein